MLKFNVNTADWIPLRIRDVFVQQHGQFISPKGTLVIVREDTRSAADNEKLAIEQLRLMLEKADEIATEIENRPPEQNFETEQDRIRATKTATQIKRYKERVLLEKRFRSQVKENRKKNFSDYFHAIPTYCTYAYI